MIEVGMDEGRCPVSLSELALRHYSFLYRFAFRLCGEAHEAEDLTQQAFLTAHKRLHQLRDPDCAKAWLCTILRNLFLTGVSSRGPARSVSLQNLPEPADEPAVDAVIDQSDLQQVLNELPEEFRTPLILFYFKEFAYREIAEQMGIPIGTVMSRLARAKSFLRRRLGALEASAAR